MNIWTKNLSYMHWILDYFGKKFSRKEIDVWNHILRPRRVKSYINHKLDMWNPNLVLSPPSNSSKTPSQIPNSLQIPPHKLSLFLSTSFWYKIHKLKPKIHKLKSYIVISTSSNPEMSLSSFLDQKKFFFFFDIFTDHVRSPPKIF